jgi:hypothetical protein
MAGTLAVIWWRDIPAQVVAKDGRRASRIVLHGRFQVAIDRAAVKAGKRAMDDYIAEWRRTQRPCGPDLETEAAAEASRLEATYTRPVLATLVQSGGVATAPGSGRTDVAPASGETAPGATAPEVDTQ